MGFGLKESGKHWWLRTKAYCQACIPNPPPVPVGPGQVAFSALMFTLIQKKKKRCCKNKIEQYM